MARDSRKHLPDPESDEGEDVDVPSSKKLKTASSSRRSGRAGKGVGGAVDQLKKVGDAVLTDRSKKSKSDRFAALGETLNPMAPPDGNRTRNHQPPSQPSHGVALNVAKPGGRFGFRLPMSDRDDSPAFKQVELTSFERGMRMISEERRRRGYGPSAKSTNLEATKTSREDTENECLPGDEEDGEANDEVLPGGFERTKSPSDETSESESEKEADGNDFNMDVEDDQVRVKVQPLEEPSGEENEVTNVLENHHLRNRRPRPPSPTRLRDLQMQAVPNQQGAATLNVNESDDDQPSRRKRFSGAPKQDHCRDPSQLGFYPAKWKDFLEECKVETRTYTAVREPWPHSKPAMNGFISDIIDMTMRKWRREMRTVEKKYYPKYRRWMCQLLFEDLASWRGEFKKAAAMLVRARYDLFPPLGSRLSKAETRQHVKRAAEALIKKSAFAHGGKDNEGHSNNFGHSIIRELIHVFFFSRDNRIGNLRPAEFGTRIPNNTLTFAVTAVRCILDGYRLNGKAKFPYFSGEAYRSKWRKYNDLIEQLEASNVHRRKLEQMCCEIARTGIAGSGGVGIDSDGNTSDEEDYGVDLN